MTFRKKPSVTRVPEAERDPALSAPAVLGGIPIRRPADQAPDYSDDDEHEAVNPEHQADLMLGYDEDYFLWTERQVALLRRRAAGELVNDDDLDWPNIAEELESVGINQKREVRSRLTVICKHLLKWRHQPRRRSRSWRDTLYVQRRELTDLFEDSPSLRPFATRVLPQSYVNGRQDAERETGPLGLPDDVCPWSLEQIISIDFLPD